MFGKLLNKATGTVSGFVNDPVGTTVDIALQPVRDGVTVIDGLSEGELRKEAALRLGADIAGGMALSELIGWYDDL